MNTPILFNSKTPEWAWLSNFWMAPLTDKKGQVWPSSEHLYQGMKTVDVAERERFRCAASAAAVKALSKRVVHQRPNWDNVKVDLMRRVIRLKFTQHADLRERLLATGDRELVHDAPWGDTFWGVCRGHGLNYQGLITMEIREELRREQENK